MTYRPKPGYHGVDAFGVTVGDGSGATTTATVTVRVTRDGTGPVVRLAAGPLKVQAGTARATIGCDARTRGRLHRRRDPAPRRPARPGHRPHEGARGRRPRARDRRAARRRDAPRSPPAHWRKAMLIVIARDKNGNGGTLGRKVVLHSVLKKSR